MHFASYNVEMPFPNNWRHDTYSHDPSANHVLRSSFDGVDSEVNDSLLQKYPALHRPDDSHSKKHRCNAGCQRVNINVSGMLFETQLKTLNRLPDTLLGNPERRRQFWNPRKHEYFLDRHRPTFQAILFYYQSGGKLKRPVEVPVDVFLNELEFYDLGSNVINAFKVNEGFLQEDDLPLPEPGWRRTVWQMFEDPSSSWLATGIMVFSVLMICASLVGFCMETLPMFKKSSCGGTKKNAINPMTKLEIYQSFFNISHIATIPTSVETTTPLDSNYTKSSNDSASSSPYEDPFFIVDAVCVAWFTIEFILRCISSPAKKIFFKNLANLVDIIAIVPFYVTLFIALAIDGCVDSTTSGLILTVRVIRVVRVFKLGKHSQGLQILAKTIRASIRELSLFALFLVLAVIVFSAAMFYAEHDGNPTYFPSIPHSFWYTIVTMTTVGYGDAVPIGVAGKVIGSLCVVAGVLVIALPVPVVVTNFSNYYLRATGRGISFAR